MLYLPSLLGSVLVIVSFHWDLLKITLFHVTLRELIEYRVHSPLVDIVVVTDRPEALARLLHDFRYENIEIHAFNSSSRQFTGQDKYDLLWEHRDIVKERLHSVRNYSTFMYVEDDTLVPWSSLVSWAIDTEVLEPLGFTRGIFRTEINHTGQRSLNDFFTDVANHLGCSSNITKDDKNQSPHYVDTIHLTDYSEESRILLQQSKEKHKNAYCLPPAHSVTFHSHRPSLGHTNTKALSAKHTKPGSHQMSDGQLQLCPIHSHFVNLYTPFQGMWIFSHTQLRKLIEHKLWDRWTSYSKDTRRVGQEFGNWGLPERSTSILFFINPPKGFHTTNVVPFYFLDEDNRRWPRLSYYGSVEHTRHAYDINCTVEEALVT